jgi:thymidine phosphorylase
LELVGQIASDDVDALAGLWLNKVVGEQVQQGDVVVILHTSLSEQILQEIKIQVEQAIVYSKDAPDVPCAISHSVTRDGVEEFEMPRMLI